MQQSLKQIQKFTLSSQCIFKLDILDYPTQWQQQMISSYLTIKKILQKSHNLIIRDLYNCSLELISQGFLYLLLIDQNNLDIFIQYMMVVKFQTWEIMVKNFQILLRDYGDIIHGRCLKNMVILLNQLIFYNSSTIIYLISDYISYYDLSQDSQQLSKIILDYFYQKLQQKNPILKQIINSICYYILPKLIKYCPYLYPDISIKIIDKIWQNYSQICIQIKSTLINIIQISKNHVKIPRIKQLYIMLKQQKQSNVKDQFIKEKIQFNFLTRKTQCVLEYIFKESKDINVGEIKYQLGWLQKSWQMNKYNQMANIKQVIHRHKDIYIGMDCKEMLLNAPEYIIEDKADYILVSVYMLRHFLATDTRLSIQMFTYLFQFRHGEENKLRNIFQQLNKLNQFKIDAIMNNRFIPQSVQSIFYGIVQQPKVDVSKALKFNPQSNNCNNNANTSINVINNNNNSNNNNNTNNNNNMNININNNSKLVYAQQSNIREESYYNSRNQKLNEIMLEQYFVSQFDIELKNMLNEPNYENFIQFLKKVAKITGQIRIQNKNLALQYARQGAKIIYLCYNNQFEDFKVLIQPQKSIIYYIISILLKQWHQVTHKIEAVKMIVKELFEIFPTAQVSFWYYFFMFFQYGGSNNRDFKNWLISKQKYQFVIPSVQILLGKSSNQFRNKVGKYLIK